MHIKNILLLFESELIYSLTFCPLRKPFNVKIILLCHTTQIPNNLLIFIFHSGFLFQLQIS